MALYPAVISPWFEQRFLKVTAAGLVPNSGGFVRAYLASTTTPVDLWTSSDGDGMGGAAQAWPLELDADGRPPEPIFVLGTVGYKLAVSDSDDVPLFTVQNVIDAGSVFAASWGNLLGTGTTYTDGDTIPPTERFALIDSSGGATGVTLSPAADMTQPLTVKNMNGGVVTLTADGSDQIEGSLSTLIIPVAASPVFPSVLLASNGVSAIYVLASNGL